MQVTLCSVALSAASRYDDLSFVHSLMRSDSRVARRNVAFAKRMFAEKGEFPEIDRSARVETGRKRNAFGIFSPICTEPCCCRPRCVLCDGERATGVAREKTGEGKNTGGPRSGRECCCCCRSYKSVSGWPDISKINNNNIRRVDSDHTSVTITTHQNLP